MLLKATRSANRSATISFEEEIRLRKIVDDLVKDPRDDRLRHLLGDKFAFIDADRISTDGKARFGCCQSTSLMARLLYFSYSFNVAVEIFMKGSEIVSTKRRAGYLPPEGAEEIKRAVELASQDRRLTGKMQELAGHAILMEPERGIIWDDPGYGHRIIWVTFSKGQDGDPQFYAIVDLSDEKVLEAGEEPKR